MKYKEYQAVTSSNPLNIGLSILIVSVIAILLGWLYSVIAYIPLVYFNFLLTIGFGFALAFAVQITSKVLKIKDRKSRLIIITIVVIIAYYSHWIAFIVQTYTEQFPNIKDYLNYWIFPNGIFEGIFEINKYGTWGIGTSGVLANGSTLSVIWFIEACIIIGVAIVTVYRFPENPFSEKLNKWYPKMVLIEEFQSVYASHKFISTLKKEGVDLILNLERGLAYKYAKISVFYLEGEDVQYLSVDNIFIETNNNSKKNVNEIIKPIEISTTEAKKLFSKFDTEKEFYLDY